MRASNLTSALTSVAGSGWARSSLPTIDEASHLMLLLFFPYLVWKNIELKVEVESLKRELQEREQLLIKAS